MPALLVGATLFSAISSVGGGIAGMQASNAEAALQKQQGDQAIAEAKANATNEAFNQNLAIGKQRLAFLANGVTLEGSPTMVLKESTEYGQRQVQSLLDQGAARKNLAYGESAQTQNKGRAALIAGMSEGVGTLAKGAYAGYNAGIFDSKQAVK